MTETSPVSVPYLFQTDDSEPRLVQAAGLALGILAHLKAEDWASLPVGLFVADDVPEPKVELTAYQADLLVEFRDEISMVRYPVRGGGRKKKVAFAVCAKCGEWIFASVKTGVPTRCGLMAGCDGKLVMTDVSKTVENR